MRTRILVPYAPPLDWEAVAGFLGDRCVTGVEDFAGDTYRRTFSIDGAAGRVAVRRAAAAPPGSRRDEAALEVELELAAVAGGPFRGDARGIADGIASGGAPRARGPGREPTRSPVRFSSLQAAAGESRPSAGGVLAAEIARRVRRLFGLDVDPAAVAAHLARDRRLRALVQARPGLRVPGAWDPFELAVRAVLGQQVSVAAARTLAVRLCQRYGRRLGVTEGDDAAVAADVAPEVAPEVAPDSRARGSGREAAARAVDVVFPTAAAIAAADPATFGIPRARAGALRGLAAAVAGGRVRLEPNATLEATVEDLDRLPGVGPWTAHYIAMRAYGAADAFPAGDLGVRRALGRDGAPATEREAESRAERWRPYRAHAVMHLWTAR